MLPENIPGKDPSSNGEGFFVRCSTPKCGMVIGDGTYGARKPRPCTRCANARRDAYHAARNR